MVQLVTRWQSISKRTVAVYKPQCYSLPISFGSRCQKDLKVYKELRSLFDERANCHVIFSFK